jgi:hypothetical protein
MIGVSSAGFRGYRMPRPDRPPSPEFFAKPRPAAGPERLVLRLESLELEISGLNTALRDLLRDRYSLWATDATSRPDALRVRLGLEEADYFIDPPGGAEFARVHIECDGARVRYLSYQAAGWFDVSAADGVLLLSRKEWEPRVRSFENYIRAAVAWRAAGRGGALVHAASAVRNGNGYLFYGESGAGKSTLSACNRRGQVLSDDLSLVLPGGAGGLDVVGSPFRGTYEGGPPIAGRFPLRAGFRLIQAPRAAVVPVARARGFAELVGNLPFVAEAFSKRPDLMNGTLAAFEALPLAHLAFTKDDSYWDAIEAAGL